MREVKQRHLSCCPQGSWVQIPHGADFLQKCNHKKMNVAKVKKIIHKDLKAFIEKRFDFDKILQLDTDEGTVELTQTEYVFFYYQNYEPFFPTQLPMLQIVHGWATGNWNYKYYKHITLYTDIMLAQLGEVEFKYDTINDYTKVLVQYIQRGLSESNLYILTVNAIFTDGTASGHRCVILFSKGKAPNELEAFLYDPNGLSQTDVIQQKYQASIMIFLKTLSKAFSQKLTCTNVSDIGLQEHSQYNIGLCIMFTYLWLFVVLRSVYAEKLPLRNAVFLVEQEIYNFARDTLPESQQTTQATTTSMLTIVHNFALKLIDLYSLDQNLETQPITYANVKSDVNRSPNKVRATKRQKRSPLKADSSERTKYGQECKTSKECETSYCNRTTNKCDHYPYDEPVSLDVDMQLFLEDAPPSQTVRELWDKWSARFPNEIGLKTEAKFRTKFHKLYNRIFDKKPPKLNANMLEFIGKHKHNDTATDALNEWIQTFDPQSESFEDLMVNIDEYEENFINAYKPPKAT